MSFVNTLHSVVWIKRKHWHYTKRNL